MRSVVERLRQGGRRLGWTAALVLCAALVPEYVLPALCVASYCVVLRGQRLRLTVGEKLLLAFLLWATVGLVYTGSRTTGLVILAQWLLFLPLLFCTRSAVDVQYKLDACFVCGAVSGGVCGGIGIAQMALYHVAPRLGKWFNPFWHFLDVHAADLLFRILPPSVAGMFPRTQFISIQTRASGTFTNPVLYAAFLCMVVPLCAYCALHLRDKTLRILGAVCLLLCVGGIAASYSRGPYLALAVSFAVLLFYGRKYALRLLGAAAALLGVTAVAAGSVFRRLLTIFNSRDISVDTHSRIWRAGLEMLPRRWLFGYGTGIGNVRQMLHEHYGIPQPHAHNVFLEILLENGVIGLALFLAALAYFAVQLVRLARQGGPARAAAVTLLSSGAAFCACGMTDYLFYGMKPMGCFLLLLGLSQCAVRVCAPPVPAEAQTSASTDKERILTGSGS